LVLCGAISLTDIKYIIVNYHELAGVRTYFQSTGGVVDASKAVPKNLFVKN
jgi:hypothetical protein